MTSQPKQSKSSQSSPRRRRRNGLPSAERPVRQVTLAEIQGDLPRFLRLAKTQEIVITRRGKPAGVLVGFENEEDWLDYRLERSPELLQEVARARADIRNGRGVRIEDLPR